MDQRCPCGGVVKIENGGNVEKRQGIGCLRGLE